MGGGEGGEVWVLEGYDKTMKTKTFLLVKEQFSRSEATSWLVQC